MANSTKLLYKFDFKNGFVYVGSDTSQLNSRLRDHIQGGLHFAQKGLFNKLKKLPTQFDLLYFRLISQKTNTQVFSQLGEQKVDEQLGRIFKKVFKQHKVFSNLKKEVGSITDYQNKFKQRRDAKEQEYLNNTYKAVKDSPNNFAYDIPTKDQATEEQIDTSFFKREFFSKMFEKVNSEVTWSQMDILDKVNSSVFDCKIMGKQQNLVYFILYNFYKRGNSQGNVRQQATLIAEALLTAYYGYTKGLSKLYNKQFANFHSTSNKFQSIQIEFDKEKRKLGKKNKEQAYQKMQEDSINHLMKDFMSTTKGAVTSSSTLVNEVYSAPIFKEVGLNKNNVRLRKFNKNSVLASPDPVNLIKETKNAILQFMNTGKSTIDGLWNMGTEEIFRRTLSTVFFNNTEFIKENKATMLKRKKE